MARKLYIFDCFGVVVSDVSTLFMNNRLNRTEQEYMRKVVFRNVDVGNLTNEDMYEIVSKRYGIPLDEVVGEWHSYEYALTDTLDLIKDIRRNGDCTALLSNASQGYIDYLFGKFDLFKYFDYLFVSSNYGVAKPDKEFYKLCVESFKEKFDAVYFTDDNPDNLKDLEQFGITAVLFTDAADFRRKTGVL